MSAGLILYNALAALVFLLCWPFLLCACCCGRDGKWRGRCGLVPRTSTRPVWVHASSVGEVNAIAPLLAELRRRRPEKTLALSTMTATGQRRARELSIGETFFFPLDFLWLQAAALSRIQPSMVILVETELWPNLLWLCHRRIIPVVLVNARLSQRSLPQYRRFGFLFRPLLDTLQLIACQSEADAERYKSLDVRPEIVRVLGNMKYDAIKGPVTPDEKSRARAGLGIPADALVMAAGSTREGEEILILDAWAAVMQNSRIKDQNAKLLIAPRHPERFTEVEAMLREREFSFFKRSRQRAAGNAMPFDVLLLDTIGELVSAYAASDLAFVGGSLVPVGGHNPLEPAALGVPVIFGPHMLNAKESADKLVADGGARQVATADELSDAIVEILSDSQKRSTIGTQAAQVVNGMRGATKRTIEMVMQMLDEKKR